MSSLYEYLQVRPLNVWDLLDILIIWFIIYNLFRFIQGSRAMQMSFGLLALLLMQIVAERLHLEVLNQVIGSLFGIIPIALLVLFQDEIRRFLASLGRSPLFGFMGETVVQIGSLEQIFQAALTLSERRVGALFVFEGSQVLNATRETGIQLDALTSQELLIDIFNPKSALHDGAVLIAGQRIVAATCVLPLSNNRFLPKHFGTRHRAAVGLSEESDALVLVVSEETGKISFAQGGDLHTLGEHSMRQLQQVYQSLRNSEGERKSESLSYMERLRTFGSGWSRKKKGKKAS